MTFNLLHSPTAPAMAPVDDAVPSSQSVIALRIVTKYLFETPAGEPYHEYCLPSNRHIQNCGGYIDKLLKYRQPAIREFVLGAKPTIDRLRSSPWPVLHGRSPHIDLILNDLIARWRLNHAGRVTLFDHGCTVGEHYDFLDLLLQATTGERAAEVLSYYGMDISPLVLSAAKLLHRSFLDRHFQLILSEGSELDLPDGLFDFSMSVGVVNHVARPLQTLDNLLRITRGAFITAIWVTSETSGFWAFNHSGVGNYFFAEEDLKALALKYPKGRFYSAEFVPEHDSSQPASYVGLSEERLNRTGSYILFFTGLSDLPGNLQPLHFESLP